MNIYIPLEVEKRELPAKILLGLESASKGNEVYIGRLSYYLINNFFKPGIVHFKSITPGKPRLSQLNFFKDNGFVTTSLDEENGLIDTNTDYVKYRFSNVSLKLVDKVFTWGKYDYTNLIKRYPSYKKKFVKSGNPRLDFWRNDFRKYYKTISNIKFENYILFSANFEVFSNVTLKDDLKFHKKSGYFERGDSRHRLIRAHKESKIIFKEYKKTIINLSLKFKDKKIVIRPHPRDNIEKWKKSFKDRPNIFISSDGYLSDWIAKSKVVIHIGCTGGLEASIRNKFTLSYNPKKNINHGHEYANKFSKKVSSEKEMFLILKKLYLIKLNNKDKFYKSFSDRAFNYYKKKSYKTIVNCWQNIGKDLGENNNNYWFLKINFFLRDLKMKILLKNYGNFKFSSFNKIEVMEMVNRFKYIDKKFKKIKINFIKNDNIKIYYDK